MSSACWTSPESTTHSSADSCIPKSWKLLPRTYALPTSVLLTTSWEPTAWSDTSSTTALANTCGCMRSIPSTPVITINFRSAVA